MRLRILILPTQMKKNNALAIITFLLVLFLPATISHAQQKTIQINASQLLPRAEVSFAPQSGTFVEGSTFQVPILINTKGTSINGIDLKINFKGVFRQSVWSSDPCFNR